MNYGLDEALPAPVAARVFRILKGESDAAAAYRASAGRAAMANAMADPRAMQMMDYYLKQGLGVDEAQSLIATQLNRESGNAMGFMSSLPGYEKYYRERQDTAAAASMAGGANYKAQQGYLNVNPIIQEYNTGNGKHPSYVVSQGVRWKGPNENIKEVVNNLAKMPGGTNVLAKVMAGKEVSLQEKLMIEAARHQNRMEEALQRAEINQQAQYGNAFGRTAGKNDASNANQSNAARALGGG